MNLIKNGASYKPSFTVKDQGYPQIRALQVNLAYTHLHKIINILTSSNPQLPFVQLAYPIDPKEIASSDEKINDLFKNIFNKKDCTFQDVVQTAQKSLYIHARNNGFPPPYRLCSATATGWLKEVLSNTQIQLAKTLRQTLSCNSSDHEELLSLCIQLNLDDLCPPLLKSLALEIAIKTSTSAEEIELSLYRYLNKTPLIEIPSMLWEKWKELNINTENHVLYEDLEEYLQEFSDQKKEDSAFAFLRSLPLNVTITPEIFHFIAYTLSLHCQGSSIEDLKLSLQKIIPIRMDSSLYQALAVEPFEYKNGFINIITILEQIQNPFTVKSFLLEFSVRNSIVLEDLLYSIGASLTLESPLYPKLFYFLTEEEVVIANEIADNFVSFDFSLLCKRNPHPLTFLAAFNTAAACSIEKSTEDLLKDFSLPLDSPYLIPALVLLKEQVDKNCISTISTAIQELKEKKDLLDIVVEASPSKFILNSIFHSLQKVEKYKEITLEELLDAVEYQMSTYSAF